MVNNAGIKGPTHLSMTSTSMTGANASPWASTATSSVQGAPPRCLKAQKSGTIINLSSTAGLFGFGNRTPYAAAKWAVIGFTKSLAIELGPYKCTANAICPGTVRGDRINRVIQGEADVRGVPFDVVARQMVGGQSIERFVEPEEIADMALFLASPAAKMVNGQAIAVDGHTETFHIR
jgi:NAD(P)-dependent dehydrogenase (short-subunit alcohol dehydrogenase family)